MENTAKKPFVTKDDLDGWAKKLDSYSVAAGIGLVSYFAGKLDLSFRDVILLITSLLSCELTAFILRKVKS